MKAVPYPELQIYLHKKMEEEIGRKLTKKEKDDIRAALAISYYPAMLYLEQKHGIEFRKAFGKHTYPRKEHWLKK